MSIGGKSIAIWAMGEQLRYRIVRESMKDYMESRATQNRIPLQKEEVIYYKFPLNILI